MTKKELKNRLRSKSYTPTPLSLGDVREVKTSSSLSPLLDRPLPPSKSKSLPGTPLNNYSPEISRISSPISPTISEDSEEYHLYYESDNEPNEVHYTTIIEEYEGEKNKIAKEIKDLHNEIHRLEDSLVNLQTAGEEKDHKLATIATKNQALIKSNNLLQKENEAVHLESKLISSDYHDKAEEVERLTARLKKEIESSKYLVAELERQREENRDNALTQRRLFDQIERLNDNTSLQIEERKRLEQVIVNKNEEFWQKWEENQRKHKKEIERLRLFNSDPNKNKNYKRQTVDYGLLARANSVYFDHSRSDSMSSLSTRVQSPTLDFELALKTPQTDEFEDIPTTPSLEEELKKSEGLSTNFTDLMAEIDNSIKISPEAVKELEDRILTLTQQNKQQEIRTQELNSQLLDWQENKSKKLQEELGQKDYELKESENREKSLSIKLTSAEERIKDLEDKLNQKTQELSLKNENWQDELEIVTNERNSHRRAWKILAETQQREQELLKQVAELQTEKQNLIENQNLEDEEWMKMLTRADEEAKKWEQEQQALIEANNHQNK